MIVALPLLAFFVLWIYSGNTRREPLWRASFIQAFIIWGAYMVLVTELLSTFKAITRLNLAIAWGALVAAGILWVVVRLKRKQVLRLPIMYRGKGKTVLVMDVMVLALVLTTLIVGFLAPPNSLEAMSFGMTRVAHWAQNQSLGHFATLDESLNSAPPGQGIALLNFYVLDASDRWSNFVAWFAWIGCIQAVMAIADLFKASQAGNRLAAVFAVTLPIGLALSSGSLDDMLSTLWLLAYVLIVFFFDKDPNHSFNIVLAGIAAALAFITKPITVIFLIPFAVYFLWLQVKQFGIMKLAQRTVAAGLIVFALGGGFFMRNLQTYRMLYQYEAYIRDLNTKLGPGVLASNLVRNISLQADLPFANADRWIYERVEGIHDLMGMDMNDPRTTEDQFDVPSLNTSEMRSGNPLHLLVLTGSSAALLGVTKKKEHSLLSYLGLLGVSAVLFLVFFKWQADGTRLHMPFFMIAAPIVGYVLGCLDKRKHRLGTFIGLILVLFAWPWALSVYERPAVVIPGLTSDTPIGRANRTSLYFVTDQSAEPVFRSLAQAVLAENENTVIGIDLGPEHNAYPIWALTKKPSERVWIQNLRASPLMERYLLPSIEPVYILSDACETEYSGYSLVIEAKGLCYFKRQP